MNRHKTSSVEGRAYAACLRCTRLTRFLSSSLHHLFCVSSSDCPTLLSCSWGRVGGWGRSQMLPYFFLTGSTTAREVESPFNGLKLVGSSGVFSHTHTCKETQTSNPLLPIRHWRKNCLLQTYYVLLKSFTTNFCTIYANEQ